MRKKVAIVAVLVLIVTLSFPLLSGAQVSAKCKRMHGCDWFQSCKNVYGCLSAGATCSGNGQDACGCCDGEAVGDISCLCGW